MNEIWIYSVIYSYYLINVTAIVYINTVSTDKIVKVKQKCRNVDQFKINN